MLIEDLWPETNSGCAGQAEGRLVEGPRRRRARRAVSIERACAFLFPAPVHGESEIDARSHGHDRRLCRRCSRRAARDVARTRSSGVSECSSRGRRCANGSRQCATALHGACSRAERTLFAVAIIASVRVRRPCSHQDNRNTDSMLSAVVEPLRLSDAARRKPKKVYKVESSGKGGKHERAGRSWNRLAKAANDAARARGS